MSSQFFRQSGLSFTGELIVFDGDHYVSRLFPTHNADLSIGPHPQKTGRISPAAHAVIAGAERGTDDNREFGNRGGGYGIDHFMAVLGDAPTLVFLSHDITVDVLEKNQGNSPFVTELYELGGFEGAFREQNTVVSEYARGVSVNIGPSTDQRRAVERFEFEEFASVNQPGNDLTHIIGHHDVSGNNPVDLFGVV